MDDTHTMFVSLTWKGLPAERAALSNSRVLPGSKLTMDFQPNTTDWYGRWRLAGVERNDWLIDREAQKNGGIFTGIVGIQAQDQAITESVDPITDHDFGNSGPKRHHDRPHPAAASCAAARTCRKEGRHGAARHPATLTSTSM